MSHQGEQSDGQSLAKVRSIADHPKFVFATPYVTVIGRGKRSQVWYCNAGRVGMSVNINAKMDISFKNKAEARAWAKRYAEDADLLFIESKGHGRIKF